uniref:pectinesterase-like n=1 Tax=Erigeron canadensis TaxID=72917 RepID=UPI001CB951C8|nr:pectinesterase-like [Erigeron canadensis]
MTMKFVLFICFLITFIVCCSSETTTNSTINGWCTRTPHYQTCDHYVAQRNTSNATLTLDQFLDTTVQAAIEEAQVVLKLAQEIESKYPNVPGKSLWGSCVDYFDGIVFTLNTVLDKTLGQPTLLDAQTWLSAGLAYINLCEKGFELIHKTESMLPLLSTNLTQLILNSLAISVANDTHHDTPSFVHWNCSEELINRLPMKEEKPNAVVAQDGSGDFKTIQDAVDAAGYGGRRSKRYVIYVKAGVYEEHVDIPNAVKYIKMFGDGINKTIITGDRHAGGDTLLTAKAGDLKDSATFTVYGRGFIATDMTFRNTAGPENGQALAFLSGSDQSVLYRCSIEGYQDTLLTHHSRQFYKECQIFGTVDFIFGGALAVFQDCDIFFRKPLPGGGLVVTAQGRKFLNESGGYMLQGCKITAADDLKPIIGQYDKAFLGRPWFAYARTIYMESFIDDLVDPQGWLDSWNYKETAYCGEYKNNGPGSSTDDRVKWPHYQAITDPKIAERYTLARFMSGDKWLPATGVPFIPGFE